MQAVIGKKYVVKCYDCDVAVRIEKVGNTSLYSIEIPQVSEPTRLLLDEIKNELVSTIGVTACKELDEEAQKRGDQRICRHVITALKRKLPSVDEMLRKHLAALITAEIIGLGPIEALLHDPDLEEIVIPAAQEPVRVYHKKYGWLKTNLSIRTEEQILNYANIIARGVGREINVSHPLLDARLPTGDRANAVLQPISHKGNTLTIRKFARDPWTIVDLIKNKTCSAEVFGLIWQSIQYEMNILFSGGTASGKTTMLNACMSFAPANQRIISIEDTRELQLPPALFWEPLLTRTPNPEGKGEVTMLNLLVNALRMRPDRIILGEVRRGQDALVLFEGMHTGHSVYATVHADTAIQTIHRLVNPPLSVPASMLDAVNLNVVMFRDRRRGIRRVYQIGEITVEEEGGAKSSLLYRWSPGKDELISHADSKSLFESLARHTGLGSKNLKQDIADKTTILEWMAKNDVKGMESVCKIVSSYYTDGNKVLDAAKKNVNPGTVIR